MAGFLRFNNLAFTGKKFQSGKSFTPSHKQDNIGLFHDPAPKGYVLTKFDPSKKSGRFAPLFRFKFNTNKNSWESNDYPERPIKFTTAENFLKLNKSVTDLYALGDKEGKPIYLGPSHSFADFQTGVLMGHPGTIELVDDHEADVETVEELPGFEIPQGALAELNIADQYPIDSIEAKATMIDASGAGYWPAKEPPLTFSDGGANFTYSDASGPLLLPAPSKVPLLPAPKKLLLLTAGNKVLLNSAIIKLLTWGDYPEWLAKFVLEADPQKATLLLESKYKPGTCWNLTVKDPLLAILTGSLSGKAASWSHPCVLDGVDWTKGLFYVWVMTGAAEDSKPRPTMLPFIQWFLPVHTQVTDTSGFTVAVPSDPLARGETVDVLFQHKPTTTKEPMAKPSYVSCVRVAFRIADFEQVTAMETFSVTNETLTKLREYSGKHGNPDDILKQIKKDGHLSPNAEQKLKAAGYMI